MSIEENKRIVTELFTRFSAGDVPGVMALLADDVTWRLPGKPELWPSAGVYDRRRIERLFQYMTSQLDGALTLRVLGVIAEGDRVAVEVEGSGDLKNGRKYRQQYFFAFELRGGKIATVREYLDTQHAFDVWTRP